MASKVVIITGESETYETINVKIKTSGIDEDKLGSVGKVFHLGDREYPITRFGTWVLEDVRDMSAVSTLLTEGGIVAALTWTVTQAYGGVNTWVSNVRDCVLTLEMRKSQKEPLLDDIVGGRMARNLQGCFEKLSVNAFDGIKVESILIVELESAKNHSMNDVRHRFPEAVRLNRLAEMERVANFMKRENFSQAFTMLKSSLEREKEDVPRMQMLLRLSTCALRLRNHEDDWRAAIAEVLSLFKTVEIPAEEIALYQKEYDTIYSLMLLNDSAFMAIEFSYAFAEIVKKIPDPAQRLDTFTVIANRIRKGVKILLSSDSCACLKSETLKYIQRTNELVQFMQKQSDCDPLVKAQCVYYAEFTQAELRNAIDKQKESIFRESSMEFKRLSSCWADLPFVITRLRLHPEVRQYLDHDDFRQKVQQICKKPALLQQNIKDPKIAKANEVLMSEFGIFASDKDIIETLNSTKFASDTPGTTSNQEQEKPLDKKQEAQIEKEKGNEAYKNQDFYQAHRHYDNAIRLDPTDAMLHSNKAAVFISQENLELARAACLVAINLVQEHVGRHDNKDVAKITARLARVEYLDKNPERALMLYGKSLALNFDPKVEEQKKECEQVVLASRFMRSPFST